jgi:ribonuclease HI
VKLVLCVDGASRGNPGHSGAGVVIADQEGRILEESSRYLGLGTNNEAEYRALILGLSRAADLGGTELEVRTDSELMVRQIAGAYRVKHANLKPLFEEAGILFARFRARTVHHVPRERNARADLLANRAIDGYLKGLEPKEAKRSQGPLAVPEESPGSTGQGAG